MTWRQFRFKEYGYYAKHQRGLEGSREIVTLLYNINRGKDAPVLSKFDIMPLPLIDLDSETRKEIAKAEQEEMVNSDAAKRLIELSKKLGR